MPNVNDYCMSCGNLKSHCTCSSGGGPHYEELTPEQRAMNDISFKGKSVWKKGKIMFRETTAGIFIKVGCCSRILSVKTYTKQQVKQKGCKFIKKYWI